MTPLARSALVAAIGVIAVGGALYLLRPSPGPGDQGSPSPIASAPPSIEGTWDVSFTRQEMLAAGVIEGEDDTGNFGHFRLTFQAGWWQMDQLSPTPSSGGTATYTVDAAVAHLFSPQDNVTFDIPYTVTLTTLTLGPGPVTFRVKPWARVATEVITATPEPADITAYRAAWNPICQAAKNAPAIANEALWGVDRLYDPAMSASDRALSLDVGREIARRSDALADQLQALNPPAVLANDHLAYVTYLHEFAAMIRDEVDLLATGDLAGARALDESGGPASAAQVAYETNWGLEPCP